MPTATHDGVRIHWDERGSGEPVLLVMGHLFPSSMWYPVVPALAERYRVVWFDNRGTGRSDSTDTATVSDLAADARAVLDAAAIGSAHAFGVSMGGGTVLQLTHESPERVRSMLLGCTAMRSATYGVPKVPSRLAAAIRYRLPVRLLRGPLRTGLYGSVGDPAAVERDLDVLAAGRWTARGIRAQDLAIASYDMTPDKVARLDVPTLVLHGTEDRAVAYGEGEQLAATIPGARLVTYEGAGHHFIVDCTERANADVLAFLDEVESARA
jgi:3-oxoadipate enol-lactonase